MSPNERDLLQEIGRRLTGKSDDVMSWQDLISNPVFRALASALGQDFTKLEADLQHWREQALAIDRAIRTLAPMGWAVSGRGPAGDAYPRALALFEETGSESAVDDYLTAAWADGGTWLRRTFAPVITLAGDHRPTRELMRARQQLLWSALELHDAGQYAGAILIVLSQVDGLTRDFTGEDFFDPKTDLDDETSIPGMPGNLAAVRKALSRDSHGKRTEATGRLHRHAIVHGRELAFATLVNSTKAFVLLGALVEWLKEPAAKRTAELEAEREARYAGSLEVDEDGRRLDRRGFFEARDSLRMLAIRESNEMRQRGRYRDDVAVMFPAASGMAALKRPDITVGLSPDRLSYWAWVETPTGVYFGISATAGEGDRFYADEGPPGAPGEDARWSEPFLPPPDWE